MKSNEQILREMGAVEIELMGEKFWKLNAPNGYSADKKFIEDAMQKARAEERQKAIMGVWGLKQVQ